MDSSLELFLRRSIVSTRTSARRCSPTTAGYVTSTAELGEGAAAVRERLREYFGDLRSTTHTVRERWREDGVWIGEVEAGYVLADHSILGPVSKVFIVHMASDGIEELRVYAAVEPRFTRPGSGMNTRATAG
ncbi:MAG: hypothetical protein ACYC91_01085 [Solirubrobacteraceae bacterium]